VPLLALYITRLATPLTGIPDPRAPAATAATRPRTLSRPTRLSPKINPALPTRMLVSSLRAASPPRTSNLNTSKNLNNVTESLPPSRSSP